MLVHMLQCDGELLPNGFLCPYEVFKGSLRLDGQTVSNLELLENRDDGGKAGARLQTLIALFSTVIRWLCRNFYR